MSREPAASAGEPGRPPGDHASPGLARAIRVHALAWLVAANGVGVLLAALLLWPEANDWLAPLTYGRWMPLHLNWQLYGWCALPLAGLLLHYYLPATGDGVRVGRLALGCWSLGLAFGGATWLAGWSSGKVFLEWAGPGRLVWLLALVCFWLIIFTQAWRRRHDLPVWAHVLLALLLLVPFVLYAAADPRLHPAADPQTGGATGRSLLGSTLGIIGVFGLVPWLLRLPTAPAPAGWPVRKLFAGALVFSAALTAGLPGGNVANDSPGQILGLATLLGWIPLVWGYGRSFVWPSAARGWLAAAMMWWLVLVVTGFLTYLPDVAERLKFTNGLVAHAHLAMAGAVTALHLAILAALAPGDPAAPRWAVLGWNLSLGVMVVVLLGLGWVEGGDPSVLYRRGGVADLVYGLRLAAGLMMLVSSLAWLAGAWRTRSLHEPTHA